VAVGPAPAEECPDFYRFVEFGLEDRDGMLRPGGTVLRGIDGAGAPILLTSATVCRAAEGLRIDGRGNRIPIVAEVAYDPALLTLEVDALLLSVAEDMLALTENAAAAHRAALASATPVTGAAFLCVDGDVAQSCQVASPYGPDYALVVYCDAQTCEMPALGYDGRISVSARWGREAEALEDLGPEILSRVEEFRMFLVDHSNRAGR